MKLGLTIFPLTIYNFEDVAALRKIFGKSKLKIHLKVDTGLHRQGFELKETVKLAKKIRSLKGVEIEGLSSHFANVEDTLDDTFAKFQVSKFNKTIETLNGVGIKPPLKHIGATASTLLHDWTKLNMVRVGIGLYGLWPSKETQIAIRLSKKYENPDLMPVLSWKARIAQIKQIKAGESVGYGRTWFAPRRTKIAIIPVGYSDGYDRKFSNNSKVIVGNNFSPVIGRVAMNMFAMDITETKNVKGGDEVILLGKKGRLEISVEELASRIDTINYEVVSRINILLPRILV